MTIFSRKKHDTQQDKLFLPHPSPLASGTFTLELVFILVGVAIIIINQLYLAGEYLFIGPVLNTVGGLVAVVIPALFFYNRLRRTKEINEFFIMFVQDLTDSLESGMTLPLALEYAAKKDYGVLSPSLKDMAAQVDWGIPFWKALSSFARKTRSAIVQRSIVTIIETYKAGGKITVTLRSIAESLVLIDNIRKERSASVHSQIMTSYLIYFIFIFILIVLQSFLMPALSATQAGALTGNNFGISSSLSPDFFAQSFINFIIIQGFFAGLVTGKLSEGSISAGFKHSILLIAFGYTAFSVFSQIQFTF